MRTMSCLKFSFSFRPLFISPTSVHYLLGVFVSLLIMGSCSQSSDHTLTLERGDRVVLVGNNLCSRMMNYGYFETYTQMFHQDSNLVIRNMCDGGNTPGFRPHSGRELPWAFPGAEDFQDELAIISGSEGHLFTPDEWLSHLKADVIIAFFGFNESFEGVDGLENYKGELAQFIDHTLSQSYNSSHAPKLVLVSPIAFEDLSGTYDLPDGRIINDNLAQYTRAMNELASAKGVPFVDVFNPSKRWFADDSQLTIDGSQLNDEGYRKLSEYLTQQLFGQIEVSAERESMVKDAVLEKNWFWHNDFKIPNGVHVFGRRYNPFGPDNYPAEIEKIRQMTSIRDSAIWLALEGQSLDLTALDASTHTLPEVETNYSSGYGHGELKYLYGDEALDKIYTAPGYKLELFASEEDFPDLANPVQLSFDNKGRLWVSTMPSYPHYRPGDARPDDKLLILEDTDGDGKADKQTVFADGLHLPVGFEFAPEGVYVSQGTNLKLLIDDDQDDRMDREEIIMSGFDDHDTHHVISAFCADPSGAIYMAEGVFLHTNVETSYGPVRATHGGFYRFAPQRRHLERTAQLSIPNPWGIAFDRWGQNFFAETSGPAVRWMMPGSVKPRYGVATHKSFDLIEDEHKVRPTSGMEFVSSRHFPDDVQGDMIINNTIGFLGAKQHIVEDDGTGYSTRHRQDLFWSDDKNFRPVDLEFAPDGSLYIVDWHNILIGHMQHNARDPLRDHVHGRIYRLTYPSRPLVEPAQIDGAPIEVLLDNLKLPEYRTRYRTKRELRSRDVQEVSAAIEKWIGDLDSTEPEYEHHLLEALWTTWGINRINKDLLKRLLNADDYRVRTAAVKVLRYAGHQIDEQATWMKTAAGDDHSRVRLEAIVAASWLNREAGMDILAEAGKLPLDEWMIHAHQTAMAHLNGEALDKTREDTIITDLTGADSLMYVQGKEIFERDGYCGTCHQFDGSGLSASGFPPLKGTKWVLGSPERLIKLTLNGLFGPIEVLGETYPGQVPMTPYQALLNDEEIASVLTYIRNSFGNKADVITPEQVAQVREATKDFKGFYRPEDLLAQHPEDEVQ